MIELSSAQAGSAARAKLKHQRDIPYLEIAALAEWEQKLRKHHGGANYVTFTINGSVGTKIDVCGAIITIEPSSQDSGYAAVHAQGEPIHYEIPFVLFGGARMASLDIVTVKIDRSSNTSSIWFRDTLVAENLRLKEGSGNRLSVAAGRGGAWVCGVVCADENPLFADRNDNSIPDDFEQQTMGRLLRNSDSAQYLATITTAWREERRSRPPTEFVFTTPLPDSYPQSCDPAGTTVHNMPNGLKFGGEKKN